MYVRLKTTDFKFDQVICCGGEIAKQPPITCASLGHTKSVISEPSKRNSLKGYKRALKLDLPSGSAMWSMSPGRADGYRAVNITDG